MWKRNTPGRIFRAAPVAINQTWSKRIPAKPDQFSQQAIELTEDIVSRHGEPPNAPPRGLAVALAPGQWNSHFESWEQTKVRVHMPYRCLEEVPFHDAEAFLE